MPQTRSNRILLWMCVLITVNQLGFGGIIPALALYARSFGVTQSAIGIAIAIYGLARFLVAMPAGQLADRVGRRPALAIGGLATAAGNLLCAYAPSFAVLVGARFVAGIGAGLVLVTGQIVLADISTPARRGRVMAIYHGVFLFAVGVGPLPGGILAERYGLRAPFFAYAVAGVVAAALAWMWIPETREAGARDGADSPPAVAPAAYAADVSPPGMNAAAMSVYRMLADLGYVLGPLTLGLATDLAGANLTLAATAVLLAGSGLLFARYAPESLRPDRR